MNKLISISGNIESSSLTVNGKSVTIVNDKKIGSSGINMGNKNR